MYSSNMVGGIRRFPSANVKAGFLLDLGLSWMICGCVIFVLPLLLNLEGHMDVKRGPPLRLFVIHLADRAVVASCSSIGSSM